MSNISKKKKVILAILIIAITALLAVSFAGCNLNKISVQFKLREDGNYALYRYKGSSVQSELIIPDTHEGKPVTELQAFSVANSAYLTKITIGPNIEVIDSWALTNCQKVTEFVVAEDNKHFTAKDGVIYTKDMKTVVTYPLGRGEIKYKLDKNKEPTKETYVYGKYNMPDSVEKVAPNAFYLGYSLYELTLSDNLIEVGEKGFFKVNNLKEMLLPNKLETIQRDGFAYMDSLRELTIPASVNYIGDYGFYTVSSKLTKITVKRASSEGITFGNKWEPRIEKKIEKKVPMVYEP